MYTYNIQRYLPCALTAYRGGGGNIAVQINNKNEKNTQKKNIYPQRSFDLKASTEENLHSVWRQRQSNK